MTRDSSVLSPPPHRPPEDRPQDTVGEEAAACGRREPSPESSQPEPGSRCSVTAALSVTAARAEKHRPVRSARSLLQYCFAPRSYQLAVPPAQR